MQLNFATKAQFLEAGRIRPALPTVCFAPNGGHWRATGPYPKAVVQHVAKVGNFVPTKF